MGDDEQVAAKKQQPPHEAQQPITPPINPPPSQQTPSIDTVSEDVSVEKISNTDLIMIAATIVIAIGTLVSAGAICFQWYEMHKGSVDTKTIADAAEKQVCAANRSADAAQKFADTAILINGGIAEAVQKLDAQAAATQMAAKTAKDALHISERAYAEVLTPIPYPADHNFQLQVYNFGRIPSGPAEIIIHEATIPVPIPGQDVNTNNASEYHWSRNVEDDLSSGSHVDILIGTRDVDASEFEAGRQTVIIAGTISYTDGFKGSKPESHDFCWHSALHIDTHKVIMAPCDPATFIPALSKLDGYPNNETK